MRGFFTGLLAGIAGVIITDKIIKTTQIGQRIKQYTAMSNAHLLLLWDKDNNIYADHHGLPPHDDLSSVILNVCRKTSQTMHKDQIEYIDQEKSEMEDLNKFHTVLSED